MKYTNNNLVFENWSFEILPVLSHQTSIAELVSATPPKSPSLFFVGNNIVDQESFQGTSNQC